VRTPVCYWLLQASVALFLTTSACGVDYGAGYYDPYAYYVPDYDDWVFWYDGDDDDDSGWDYPLSASLSDGGSSGKTAQPAPTLEQKQAAKAQLMAVNASILDLMRPVSELAEQKPSSVQAGTKSYGPENFPAENPSATFRLTVLRLAAQKYGWRLSAKPLGADDSRYQIVLTGRLQNVVQAHHGDGLARFDFDGLHAINPAVYAATGRIIAATSIGPKGQIALAARLFNFSPDDKTPPVSTLYAGERSADGKHHITWLGTAAPFAGVPDTEAQELLSDLPGNGKTP
jgi:hypothetical protein